MGKSESYVEAKRKGLDGNHALDVVPGIVVGELEIFVAEGEYILDFWIYVHGGQMAWCACDLEFDLFDVVEVDVCVTSGIDEIAGAEVAHLCHHHGEEGVAGDVEGNAEKGVGAALIELAAEAAVGHVELEEDVAGWQIHVVKIGNVPC